jgi:hypothetical protein
MRIALMFGFSRFCVMEGGGLLKQGAKKVWLKFHFLTHSQQVPLVNFEVIFFKFLEELVLEGCIPEQHIVDHLLYCLKFSRRFFRNLGPDVQIELCWQGFLDK